MIKPEDRLIEDRWYHVHLEYNPYRDREIIEVNGKHHFIGRLVVHVGNKLVFNLNNEEGSVIIPFDKVRWMVPLYHESRLKIEPKVEYWNIEYKKENKERPWE